MKNKQKIIGAVVVLLVVVVLAWAFTKGQGGQQVSNLDTIDTTMSFYNPWLEASQSATSSPYKEGLDKSPILSQALRDKIESQKSSDAGLDPVLCQAETPDGISIRSVYVNDDMAQALITSKDKKVTDQAIVTLAKLNDGWYINDITCSAGEFAPEKEFSFEKEGNLLKGSIPPPYNPKDWHLVFEQNGELGHVVPLFFDSKTECVSLDGSKAVCDTDKFTEAEKVSVHGQMTERGVNVQRLEVLK